MIPIITWATDDPCPDCGTSLSDTPGPDGEVTQECRACGWSVVWAMDEAAYPVSVTP